MKLQDRNLAFGMQGDDGRELQRDLGWLGFSLVDETGASFGETTRAAVQQFQKQNRLKPTGVVDAKIAAAINKRLGALKRVVRGSVRQPDGKPLERTSVQAFDKNLRTESKLGRLSATPRVTLKSPYVFQESGQGDFQPSGQDAGGKSCQTHRGF